MSRFLLSKRSCWILVILLWLVAVYPASLGPANYAQARGWIGPSANALMQVVYDPLAYIIVNDLPLGDALQRYADWFGDHGADHAAL